MNRDTVFAAARTRSITPSERLTICRPDDRPVHLSDGVNRARFYRLPVNEGTTTFVRRPGRTPDAVPIADEDAVVFQGGENLPWSIEEVRP